MQKEECFLDTTTVSGLFTGVGVDLKMGLVIILAIECAAIAIMLFVPKLARLMAVLMLVSFVLVLLNEMIAGNLTSCGCLGSYSPPPWLMLAIDVGLLILVVAIRPATLGPSCAARDVYCTPACGTPLDPTRRDSLHPYLPTSLPSYTHRCGTPLNLTLRDFWDGWEKQQKRELPSLAIECPCGQGG